jgi:hypothetical protein
MDKPKMVFAGVEAGAKIFVELNGESGAAAAASALKQKRHAKFFAAFFVAELFPCRMFHKSRARIETVCWPPPTKSIPIYS